MENKERIKLICTRFAFECRKSGVITNSETCDLFDEWIDEQHYVKMKTEDDVIDSFVIRLLGELNKRGVDTASCDGDALPEGIIADFFISKIDDIKDNKEKTVTCECGTVFPMEYDVADEDGNHTCPSCVRSYFEGRLDDAETLLRLSIVQIDHLDTRDNQLYTNINTKRNIKTYLYNGDDNSEDGAVNEDNQYPTTQCPKCFKDRIGRSCHDCQQYW